MDLSILFANLLTAPILFFFLGMLATAVRSDLAIPPEVARLLPIYLLFAIGLKGGAAFYGDDAVGVQGQMKLHALVL